MKKLSIIILLALASSFAIGQTNATISNEMLIELPIEEGKKLDNIYVLDISNLNFENQEKLNEFCERLSFGFQSLVGNLSENTIRMTLDFEKIGSNYSGIEDLNSYFNRSSTRFNLIYESLQ